MTGGSCAHLTIRGCHVLARVTTQYPGPGGFRGLSRPPSPPKSRARDQKFGKQRGVTATKLPRSHRPPLPTPATFPRAPELTSDPRSGRETAEQGCITAEKLCQAAHIPEQGSAAATAGYLQAPRPVARPGLWGLPSFSQLCLDTRPGDISRPC